MYDDVDLWGVGSFGGAPNWFCGVFDDFDQGLDVGVYGGGLVMVVLK